MLESPAAANHADVRCEKGDANVTPILAAGAGLVLILLLVYGTITVFFDFLKEAPGARATPSILKARGPLPGDLPEPRLQENESADLDRFRRKEADRIDRYGWIDAERGIVHIPIAEAMRRFADADTAAQHGIRVEPAGKKGGRP
jgi:hypothetical protein